MPMALHSRARRALSNLWGILVASPLLAAISGCGNQPEKTRPDPAADSSGSPVAVTAAPTAAPTVAPTTAASAAPPTTAQPSAGSDVVASASAQYDSGPSVIASDKIDGAALRKRHVERIKSDTSPVTVLKGEGPMDLGKRICEAVVPKRPAATPVLLKPNICGFDGVKDPAKFKGDDGVTGRITQPEFVRGVVQCLKGRGHKAITIAEGCGHSHKFW